jgi:pullulanase/glycogen debranching enzyme
MDNNGLQDIQWYDEKLNHPDWKQKNRYSIAFFLDGSAREEETRGEDNDFFVVFNAGTRDIKQMVPAPPGKKAWFSAINTADEGSKGISPAGQEPPVNENILIVKPRSSVVLLTKFI